MPTWLMTPPVADELLSSYLSRCSQNHGVRPTSFCAFHFPGHAVWDRDLDVSASDNLIAAIAQKASLSEDAVRSMTLRTFATVAALDRPEGPFVRPGGKTDWVGVVGMYHRTRRQFGLQQCPLCMRDQLAYRRIWRLSFVTMCPHHRVPLQDACSGCGAPFVPHRQAVTLRHCHACGMDLVQERAPASFDQPVLDAAYGLQMRFLRAIETGSSTVNGAIIPLRDFVRGTHLLTRLPRRRYALGSDGQPGKKVQQQPVRCAVESLRCGTRLPAMAALHTLLDGWPDSGLQIARERRLTQRSFAAATVNDTQVGGELPPWIAAFVGLLPAGKTYNRGAEPRRLRNQLRQLHRTQPPGWRTLRAEALLAATGFRP